MPSTLTIGHPDISSLPQTFITVPAVSGDTELFVQNSTDFSVGNYVVLNKYSSPNSQIILLVNANPTLTSMSPGALDFSYAVDSPVVFIPFNSINIYRSITGTGGTYSFLVRIPIQVDQDFSTYTDMTAVSPYSYRYTFFNSNLNIESDFSSEYPFSGFPFYSLNSLQRRTLTLFVDKLGEYITQESISDWVNEFVGKLNRGVTDSETGPFVDFVKFVPGSSEYTDISSYKIESVFFAEYSADGVSNWMPISPTDSRINSTSPITQYSWDLIGNKFFVKPVNPQFPTTYTVRLWFYTQQSLLINESDVLPILYRSYTDVVLDYCMMRANEQSRRLSESADYYRKKTFGNDGKSGNYGMIVEDIRSMIAQGNMSMATTWVNSFPVW